MKESGIIPSYGYSPNALYCFSTHDELCDEFFIRIYENLHRSDRKYDKRGQKCDGGTTERFAMIFLSEAVCLIFESAKPRQQNHKRRETT